MKKMNALGMLAMSAVVFLIVSAIVMALWNGPVKNSLKPDSVQKIDYPTAMGLTLFSMLIFGGSSVVVMSCN